jgi:hypothetical protein
VTVIEAGISRIVYFWITFVNCSAFNFLLE